MALRYENFMVEPGGNTAVGLKFMVERYGQSHVTPASINSFYGGDRSFFDRWEVIKAIQTLYIYLYTIY